MNLRKKIILLAFITCIATPALQARNPYSFISNNYAASTGSIFIAKAQQLPLQPMLLKPHHKVNPFKNLASFMAWDFKMVIRLNRNMNIVFSYN